MSNLSRHALLGCVCVIAVVVIPSTIAITLGMIDMQWRFAHEWETFQHDEFTSKCIPKFSKPEDCNSISYAEYNKMMDKFFDLVYMRRIWFFCELIGNRSGSLYWFFKALLFFVLNTTPSVHFHVQYMLIIGPALVLWIGYKALRLTTYYIITPYQEERNRQLEKAKKEFMNVVPAPMEPNPASFMNAVQASLQQGAEAVLEEPKSTLRQRVTFAATQFLAPSTEESS